MIKSIHFENFKVLKSATLPLGRFTLIVGPNGSGKSTALFSLLAASNQSEPAYSYEKLVAAGAEDPVKLTFEWDLTEPGSTEFHWEGRNKQTKRNVGIDVADLHAQKGRDGFLRSARIYSLQPHAVSQPAQLIRDATLQANGSGIAAVLDELQGNEPERFEAVNQELHRWLPEYDRILFDIPQSGYKTIRLRTTNGHKIPADDLSDGTLLALAILTIAHLPEPPKLVAFEDPDQGLHPRLLGQVQEALYRLAYPERFGDDRAPVQVIATTHSPYFLDLFKDSPEEIVIAEKTNGGATFKRVVDHDHIEEILEDTPLGEVCYSGVLGGVPAES